MNSIKIIITSLRHISSRKIEFNISYTVVHLVSKYVFNPPPAILFSEIFDSNSSLGLCDFLKYVTITVHH